MRSSFIAVVISAALLLIGCSSSPAASLAPVTLRLGYFPNVTHAAAVVGVAKGIYQDALAAIDKLEMKDDAKALFVGDVARSVFKLA